MYEKSVPDSTIVPLPNLSFDQLMVVGFIMLGVPETIAWSATMSVQQ
jgi:hypothetical protein